MGVEKKLDAPLIWAALSHPELEVNELKDEALASVEMVMPKIGEAVFVSEPPVKSKLAKVAERADEKPRIKTKLRYLNVVAIMGDEKGVGFEDAGFQPDARILAIKIMLEFKIIFPKISAKDWRLNV